MSRPPVTVATLNVRTHLSIVYLVNRADHLHLPANLFADLSNMLLDRTVAVTEHDALVGNILGGNLRVFKIFDYLCRSIKVLLVYFLLNRL